MPFFWVYICVLWIIFSGVGFGVLFLLIQGSRIICAYRWESVHWLSYPSSLIGCIDGLLLWDYRYQGWVTATSLSNTLF